MAVIMVESEKAGMADMDKELLRRLGISELPYRSLIVNSLLEKDIAFQSLDLIWAENIFPNVREPEPILQKLASGLKTGGMLIVSYRDHVSALPFLLDDNFSGPFFPLINFPELIALLAADFDFYSAYPAYGLLPNSSNEQAIAAYWQYVKPEFYDLCTEARKWRELYQETANPEFLKRFNFSCQIVKENSSYITLPSLQHIALTKRGDKI